MRDTRYRGIGLGAAVSAIQGRPSSKVSSSAMLTPPKQPMATVFPLRIRRTASHALTILFICPRTRARRMGMMLMPDVCLFVAELMHGQAQAKSPPPV